MADNVNRKTELDRRLNRVLAEYIRRRDSGEHVDVESWCTAYPDLADALRSYAEGEGLLQAMIQHGEPADVDSNSSQSAETIRPRAAHRTDLASGGAFGRYCITPLLGEGAMGAIYLAEDTNLGRHVALKIPKFTGLESDEFRQRFTREARATAKLDHPNICRVYDAGEIGGTPFITMEYIDGPPLSQFIGVGEFTDQRRIAEIISAVASGLAHAHEQGILHRDLKPGNVLMKGSTIPCVTDFGLARSVDAGEESRLTQDGMILGTPAYMAPEQIEAQADTVGPTADVYALGGMFYEMLTGRIPFQGSVMSILAQALRDLPKPPSKLRSDIDSKLEDLCLQMMDKSPAKRPASMQEVVKRMQSWLEQTSQATQAERQKAKQTVNRLDEMKARIVDQIQRGQFAAAVAGLKKLADVKTPDAADYVAWARKKLPEVQKMPKRLREGLPALVSTAEICMRAHDYAQASQLLVDIPEDFMTDEARSVLNQAIQLQDESDLLLADLKRCVQTKQYLGIEDNLKRLLELKPGNRFARGLWDTLNTYQRIAQSQRTFRYDKRGKLQPLLEDNFLRSWLFWGAVCFAAVFGLMTWGITIYLRDGDQQLAVSVNEDWLKEQGGQLTLAVDGKDHTISAGQTVVTVKFGDHGFSVKHGDTMVHNPQTFAIEKGTTQVLHIDASGMHVAAAENPPLPPDPDPAPIVINAPLTPLPDGPAGLVKSLNGHKGVVSQVAWSPDGRTVASVSSTDGTLRVWDVETGGERHQSKCLLGYALAIHPDGKLVATSSPHEPGGHAMTIYNMETGKKVAETPQVAKPILSAMFSADGQYFAIHCRDGAGIHVYDVSQLPDVRVAAELPGGDSGWAVSLAFLPDSQQLLAGSSGEKYGLRLFDVATQREIRSYRERNGAKCSNIMPSIAVHPSGKQFHVFSNSSYRLTELNVFNDTAVRALGKDIREVVYSPSGEVLVGISHTESGESAVFANRAQKRLTAWKKEVTDLDPHGLAISPDGRFIAISGQIIDSKGELQRETLCPIHVWRLPQEVWPKLKSELNDAKPEVAIDSPRTPLPDGPLGLAPIRVSAQEILSYDFTEPEQKGWRTLGMSVNPNGAEAYLSSGKYLWKFDLQRKTPPVELSKKGGAYDIDFSPDGRTVVLARAFGRVELWDTEPWKERVKLQFSDTSGQAGSVRISPDGRWVGAAMVKGSAAVWEMATGRLVKEFPVETGNAFTLRVAFTPDSQQMIVSGQGEKERHFYTVTPSTGEVTDRVSTSLSGCCGIVLGKGGRAVLANASGAPLNVADVETWTRTRTFGVGGAADALAWSPDSRVIATGVSTRNGIRLFDGQIYGSVQHITVDSFSADHIRFSRDSRILVASGVLGAPDSGIETLSIRAWKLDVQSQPVVADPEKPSSTVVPPDKPIADSERSSADTAVTLDGLTLSKNTTFTGTYIQQSPVATHEIVVMFEEQRGNIWYGEFKSIRAKVPNGGVTNTGFKFACEFTITTPASATLSMVAITGNTSRNAVRDTTSNWVEDLKWDGKSLSNQVMKLTAGK